MTRRELVDEFNSFPWWKQAWIKWKFSSWGAYENWRSKKWNKEYLERHNKNIKKDKP